MHVPARLQILDVGSAQRPPSRATWLRTLAALATATLLVYVVYRAIIGRFFPSTLVEWLAVPPSLAGAAGVVVTSARAGVWRREKALHNRWVRWLVLYLLGSLALAGVLQLTLAKGAAGVLNGWFGTPASGLVTVERKHRHSGRSGCTHAIHLAELRGYPVCVTGETFASTAVGDRFEVVLQSSWLGVSLRSVGAKRPSSSPSLSRPEPPPSWWRAPPLGDPPGPEPRAAPAPPSPPR